MQLQRRPNGLCTPERPLRPDLRILLPAFWHFSMKKQPTTRRQLDGCRDGGQAGRQNGHNSFQRRTKSRRLMGA